MVRQSNPIFVRAAVLRYDLHIRKVTHLKGTPEWVLASAQNCTIITTVVEHFSHPVETPVPPAATLHYPPPTTTLSPKQPLIYLYGFAYSGHFM